jgi:predicted regulator of Ras-like GTPase activity (Roadblock/LC7/MglB family)
MAIKGHLREMNLPMLIQHACTLNERVRLDLQRGDAQAALYFDDNELVHATLDDQIGEEAVYHALKWEDGEFQLEPCLSLPARTIDVPWSVLLVNGLQRYDEERWDALDYEEEIEMPENIHDILVELGRQTSGFIAASVVGRDGLGIAEHSNGAVDPEAINAQTTLLFKLVDTSVGKLAAGALEDYLLTTKDAYVLLRYLDDNEHFLGIAVDRNGTKLGSLRLNSRIYASRVSEAMPR